MQQFEKTPFYLKASQVGNETIWRMIIKKQSGLRLSRNDIVRHIIDQATLDSLEGIKRHVKKTTTHPQEQLNKYGIEERFRTDTRVHHFKK